MTNNFKIKAVSISMTVAQGTIKRANPSAKHHKWQKKDRLDMKKQINKEQPVTLIHHNRDI